MITEPITTLTDYAIALETVVFTVLLFRNAPLSVKAWALAFLSVGIAAIAGGTYHGFHPILEFPARLALWQIMLYALGAASFFMLLATTLSTVSRRLQPWFIGIILAKLGIYLYQLSIRYSFRTAVLDYLVAMVVVLLLQIRAAYQGNVKSARWIIAGILVSGIAAAVLQTERQVVAQIRSVDLYHVLQGLGLYCLYQGVRLLKSPIP